MIELTLDEYIPHDKAESYVHLPIDVPPGIGRIEVRYSYDFAIGDTIIDIGLFDQRGLSDGFRGWSGSDRSEFFVAVDSATPGYLVGPIQAGTWYICLGCYKIAPQGCHCKVLIRLTPGASDGQFAPLLNMEHPRATRPRGLNNWYRGELHCHTVHSDGDSQPRDLIALAKRLGLDFLAITDHNVTSHLVDEAALYPEDLILIPGYEVTTYKGHWNIWGNTHWIDFRIETAKEMEQKIREALAHGYLPSCNHPCRYGCTWQFEHIQGYQSVEVWNGPWERSNEEGLEFWEARLRSGERLTAVGGSDAHHLAEYRGTRIGIPTTWIYCLDEPTAANLLAGLRAGHVFVSDMPDGPQIYLWSGSVMMGDQLPRPASGILEVSVRVVGGRGLSLEVFGANGCLHTATPQTDDQTFIISLPMSETPYVRAQLMERGARPMMRALTNPLYLTV